MKVLMKIVGILGMTVVLMAVGSVSAEDQPTTTVGSGTAITIPQQIPIPFPPIETTNWHGELANPCSYC